MGSGMMPSITLRCSKILRGDLHRRRRVGGLLGFVPQDGRAAFRRYHRIDRMLEHVHFVGRGDGDRPARSAFADDGGDEGRVQRETGLRRTRDRFGLSALFRADAGIGARRIDQRDHRQAETIGHVEQALHLAIPFRHRHAEIVLQPRFGVVALLMADDRDGAPAKPSEPRR